MGHQKTKRGIAGDQAVHRPPDFLGGVNICRANEADSARFFWELIKGRGMVRRLTDISIFPVSSDWNVHHPGQMENRSLENLTLSLICSLPLLLARRRNVTSKLQLGTSLLRVPCVSSCADHRPASSHFLRR